MNRGLELDLHLIPGHTSGNFTAAAIGNLVAYQLQSERGEPLEGHVLQVEESHHHHFRLVTG